MFGLFNLKAQRMKQENLTVIPPTNGLENVEVYAPNVEANLQIEVTANPEVYIPEMPFNVAGKMISQWSGKQYSINLQKLECSCPDFVKNRSSFKNRDPRRVCKHLHSALIENGLFSIQNDLCKVVIESGWVASEFSTFSINGNSEIAFIYGESDWINVFVRNRKPEDSYGEYSGKFNDYGLSKSEDRWSYGRPPAGVIMIKSLLRYNQLI